MTTWERGPWLNPPPSVEPDVDDLLVTAARGNDLWQRTSYGLRRDSGHALLAPPGRRHRPAPGGRGAFRLVRLAPFTGTWQVLAGPYCCAPETEGFCVRFTSWSRTDADTRLH